MKEKVQSVAPAPRAGPHRRARTTEGLTPAEEETGGFVPEVKKSSCVFAAPRLSSRTCRSGACVRLPSDLWEGPRHNNRGRPLGTLLRVALAACWGP